MRMYVKSDGKVGICDLWLGILWVIIAVDNISRQAQWNLTNFKDQN